MVRCRSPRCDVTSLYSIDGVGPLESASDTLGSSHGAAQRATPNEAPLATRLMTPHKEGTELEALRLELEQTAAIADLTEQMLEIVGVVDAALAPVGIRPVVVGGLAVAYWVSGLYVTADIDVVMPHAASVEERLAALGFQREGRYWTMPGRQPVFEAPGSTLVFNREGYTEAQLASGRSILVQDVEELLLLRLDEFVATGNADVFQQCLWLLGSQSVDRGLLERRAGEQSLGAALDALDAVAAEIEQHGRKLEIWEITDLSKVMRGRASNRDHDREH